MRQKYAIYIETTNEPIAIFDRPMSIISNQKINEPSPHNYRVKPVSEQEAERIRETLKKESIFL